MNNSVGRKVKELRQDRNMTLKDLSEKSGLSTGYLSQFERGLTSIAIEYLESFASIFNVPIKYFFNSEDEVEDKVIRSYNQKVLRVSNKGIYKSLSGNLKEKTMLPKIIELLPLQETSDEMIASYPHHGEEFVYVLEGVLTLLLDDLEHTLYPGDALHYPSTISHNWVNKTNRMVKFIGVHTPSDFDDNFTDILEVPNK